MSGSQDGGSYRKPEWANWVEDPHDPHLVRGVECRGCSASLTSILPKERPDGFGPIWLFVDHGDGCKHRQRDTDSDRP